MLDELRVRFTMSQGWFPGQCLSSLTNGWVEVKCLFRQLLESLDYLHRNEIIHRYGNNSALDITSLCVPGM